MRAKPKTSKYAGHPQKKNGKIRRDRRMFNVGDIVKPMFLKFQSIC
jgi:hypothetical protein